MRVSSKKSAFFLEISLEAVSALRRGAPPWWRHKPSERAQTDAYHPRSRTNADYICAPATCHLYVQINSNRWSALAVTLWLMSKKVHIFEETFGGGTCSPEGGTQAARKGPNNRGRQPLVILYSLKRMPTSFVRQPLLILAPKRMHPVEVHWPLH